MSQLIYAMFDSQREAKAVVQQLLSSQLSAERCSLQIHKNSIKKDNLSFGSSDGLKGLLYGVLAGIIGGALLGGVLTGAFGLLGIGGLAGAMYGAGGGVIIGALGGALSGAGRPNQKLVDLAESTKQGDVLVTADCADEEVANSVLRTFREHNARISETPIATAGL